MSVSSGETTTTPTLEDLLHRVRARGGRLTTARRAVLQALVETAGAHLSPEELATLVNERHPDIHLSTVYRTLEALERMELVVHVHLGHGPSTFHLADHLHHHAVCEECGTVIELHDDLLESVAERLRQEHGFVLDTHHFALSGRCADCATP